MKLARIFEEIIGNRRGATPDDIRKVFGDYHNLLRWLTGFLIGDEKLAGACIVDACTIAETQTPDFHEWLVRWGARATVGCALQIQQANIAELAPKYESSEPAHLKHPALSPEYFLLLIKNAENIHARLDVLCRFVLILRGIANESDDKVAAQLGVSSSAVEAAYCVAFDTLELSSEGCYAVQMFRRVTLATTERSPTRLLKGAGVPTPTTRGALGLGSIVRGRPACQKDGT